MGLIVTPMLWVGMPALAGNPNDVMRLLDQRRCAGCQLQDADLVHADLRGADLHKAQLQRANLSRARLDGANFQGADLRFISLQGASLRGANLKGAWLDGADLRKADLSNALIDPGALGKAHWEHAIGLNTSEQLSYAELHNAGVDAARKNRFPEAERFFSEAIRKQPLAAVSWLARAICRSEQGKTVLAANDLGYAIRLYEQGGELGVADELKQLRQGILAEPARGQTGNGKGMEAVGGAMAAFKILAPIAARAFMPVGF
jgi:tetratricopeptide (TPR) repeat protein